LVIEDKVNIGAEVSIVYEAFSHTVLGNQSVDLGIGEVEIESG
jgi:UDP-3-O-[3-hydroxymyristoyl] glucosamine N-acyltransferase